MTRYKKEFAQITSIAKARSSALVVGGGPYVSSDDHAGLLDTEIDLSVLDEGEITFAEVIDRVRSGRPFDCRLRTRRMRRHRRLASGPPPTRG